MRDGEDYSEALRETIREAGVKRTRAAGLLRVSEHTLKAWLRPATTASANPAPLWAVDLLRLRLALPPHPVSLEADERLRQAMLADTDDKN